MQVFVAARAPPSTFAARAPPSTSKHAADVSVVLNGKTGSSPRLVCRGPSRCLALRSLTRALSSLVDRSLLRSLPWTFTRALTSLVDHFRGRSLLRSLPWTFTRALTSLVDCSLLRSLPWSLQGHLPLPLARRPGRLPSMALPSRYMLRRPWSDV